MVGLKLLVCLCWVNADVIWECFWIFGLQQVDYVSFPYKCFITRSYVEMGWIVVIVMVLWFIYQSTASFLEFDITLSSVLSIMFWCVCMWIKCFVRNWLILTFEVVNGDFSYYDCD